MALPLATENIRTRSLIIDKFFLSFVRETKSMIRSQSDKKDLSRRKPPVSDLTRSRMNSSGMASTSHPSSKPNSGTEKESKRVLLSDNGRSKSDRTRGSEKQEAIARHMALAARSPASSIAANYQASSKEGIDNEGWKSKNVAGESDHMTESDLQASNKEDKQLRVSFTDSNSVREAAFRDWAIKKQALATSKQTKPQPSKQNGNGLKESEDLDATFSRDDARQVTVVKENAWSDSSTMREAIYSQWLNEKESRLKQKQAEKVGKEKQEKEELERAMKEKKTESRKAFESWREKKTEELKKKLKDQKVQGKEKEEENKEKEVTRLHESKVLFGTWKEKKDDVLKDRHLEVLRQKTEERKSSEEQVKKKRGENKKSYDQW